jgi:hypothetical protein
MLAVHSDAPLIKRCRQEVLLLAGASIERCLGAACQSLVDAMHDDQSIDAHQGMQDALERLKQCRSFIQSSFPMALDHAIAEALDTTGDEQPKPENDTGERPSEIELALLDDSELSHFVEIARLVQVVQPVVERALSRLDALMSSALDQPVVQPDLDPMRPEVLCRALMRVLDEYSESTEVRRLWLRHLAKSYARELNGLYEAVANLLEREGMPQAQYRVKLTEGGAGPAMVAVVNAEPMAPTMPAGQYPSGAAPVMSAAITRGFPARPMGTAGAQMPEEELSDEEAIRRRRAPMPQMSDLASPGALVPQALLHEFLYNRQLAQQYDVPLPQEYYAAVQRQLAQMAVAPVLPYDEAAQSGALATADHSARAVTLEMLLPLQHWGQQMASPRTRMSTVMELKARAAQISQALGIHVVRALLTQIAADQRILVPIREALVALEPALLRLTLAEPRFLADNVHPTRRFIEEIVQHSLKYNDEFSSKFNIFVAPVRHAIRTLDAITEPSGQDFEHTLEALRARWKALDEAEQRACEQGVRTMEFAQKRQELADKIAWDFSKRSDLAGAPRTVVNFLLKDWSLVIAHAQLTDVRGGIDPGGYLSIVSNMLWSVKCDEILRDLPRLFDVLPRVMAMLRKGLDILGKDTRESQALFDTLLHFHEPALKLRRMHSTLDKNATQEELIAILQLPKRQDLVIPDQLPSPEASTQPWLGRHEREAIGFIDQGPDNSDTSSSAGQPVKLREGDWVNLYFRRKWRRAKLVWISDSGVLYLFVGYGGRMHSMTRQTLEKLLSSGQVRPLEGDTALDEAFKIIATSAKPKRAGMKEDRK